MVAISSLGRHQVDLPHWPSWQNAHADHEHNWSINRCKDVHGGIFGKSYKRSRLGREPLVHLQIRASLEVKSRFARCGPKFRICRNTRTPEKIVCAARKQFNAPEFGERGLDTEVDIVIVGAGIIGLSIAHTLLHDTTFSVALVDRAQPCAGATGAGQGYIWLGNRQPGTPAWDFAKWSKSLWEGFALELSSEPLQSVAPLGWHKNGSLLVAANGQEAAGLQKQVALLNSVGVGAELLDAQRTRALEPALSIGDDGGAAFLPDDAQLDAELAVAALRDRCKGHVAKGRYTELFYELVQAFLWSPDGSAVEGVQTMKRKVRARRSVVMATGAWTTDVLAAMSGDGVDLGTALAAIKPRKGHLLIVEGPGLPRLKHALMECEYSANSARAAAAAERSARLPQTPNPGSSPSSEASNRSDGNSSINGEGTSESGGNLGPEETSRSRFQETSTSVETGGIPPGPYKPSVRWEVPPDAETLQSQPSVSVSMTATTDAFGRLLIGSSREFSGFDTGIRDETIVAIVKRAARFLPVLEEVVLRGDSQKSVRTGLRPYASNGRPSIGAVPGVDGLLVAAGHEGSGLCMAPGTAAVVRDLLLGATPEIDCSYFTPEAIFALTGTEILA